MIKLTNIFHEYPIAISNGFGICEFCVLENQKKWPLKSFRQPYFSFYIILNGNGQLTIDFITYQVIGSRVFFISPEQIQLINFDKGTTGIVVLFTEEYYNQIFTGNDAIKSDSVLNKLAPFVDIDEEEKFNWISILNLMDDEMEAQKKLFDSINCLELKVFVLKYYRKCGESEGLPVKSNHKLELITLYKDLINKYFTSRKTPAQYAPDLNISANYLNALCTELTGKTAGSYIKSRVILEAKRLLTHSDQTISQIAYSLGFDDKSHFGKYFKKAENITPDGFRKMNSN